ncbi:MAG: hypothetical protein KGJ37_05165, partial [Verrucomicrobiota bacterium]|nr:hypothetical protein [Verrucomicrobiota bacterium]
MKALRWILIGLAVITVLLAVAGTLALVPAVQTSLANKILAGQPGLHVTIGRVAAGFNGVKLENVHVTQPGLAFTLPSAEADFSLLAVLQKKVFVRKLVAKGWTLDLTVPGAKSSPPAGVSPAPAPTAVKATVAAFQGVFQRIHLPVDLAVDGVDVAGEAIFPTAPKQPPGRAKITVTGGRLTVNQDGRFDFQVDVALAGSTAPVQTIAMRGALTATLDTPRTFSQLSLTVDATATGSQFPKGARVHAVASAQRASDGEHYTAAINAGSKQLFELAADYPTGASKLTGTWRLNADDADVAPFALGHALPTFQASGAGKLESDAAFSIVHAVGRIHVATEHLEAVRAELSALGHLTFDGDFDLVQNGPDIRLNQLALVIAGAQPIAEVHAVQPFEFNAKTGELKVADPAKDLLRFDLKGLPLAWARPFFPAMTVTGSDISGTVLTHARDGGLHFESSEPFTVQNLAVARNGRPLARLDRVALNTSADYTPQGWQAEITASGQNGSKQLFTLQTKAGCLAGPKQPIKATGRLNVDLSVLLTQPALVSSLQLTRGTARADFQASLDETKQIAAKLTIDDLASPQVQSLPSFAADARVEIASDGKITFEAPLVLKNDDRKSDLTAAGTFQSTAEGPAIDARVTSTLLVVDDFKMLAAPFSASPNSAPVAPSSSMPAPTPAVR